jgi:predicted TIM-barrel fold metal-dependent hydrolase
MDYPHPLARLTADGRIDLSGAYPEGIGAWDSVAITYGYAEPPAGADERPALARILSAARARGITFLTDQDARPSGSAHPQTHLWDNGADAATELGRMMQVRRAALERFGENAIRTGMPLATMEEVLVPLYLYHRYQAEAATKAIGGQAYTYALRGDEQVPVRPVAAADQRRALDAVLATLAPDELALPASVLQRIPPRPFTWQPHRELFTRYTGPTFDALSPAASAAGMTFELLFDPQRAARLVEQHALDSSLPGLTQVLERTTSAVFSPTATDAYRRALAQAVQRAYVDRLMALAADAPMPQVRAEATEQLRLLRLSVGSRGSLDSGMRAHYALLESDIGRFLQRPWEAKDRREPPAPPPGSPIGDQDPEW